MSLRDDIKRHEGLRLVPYKCSEGYWTIGVGHCISDDKTITYEMACRLCDAPWTESQAETQLDKDISRTLRELDRYLPALRNWPQKWQDAVTEMAFQMGVAGVLKFRRMLGAIADGDGQGAHDAALDSLWAKQTPSRAAEVAAKFL